MDIPKALPLIVECLKSENHLLQQIGSLFASAVILNSDGKEKQKQNIGLLIAAQVVPILVNLLSSPNYEVTEKVLHCLSMISFHFSKQIVSYQCLPLVCKFLKSKHVRICWVAAQLILNISNELQNIAKIVKAEGIGPLVELLDSNDADICGTTIGALVNIVWDKSKWWKIVLDRGILNRLKNLLNHKNQEIKYLATLFITNITYHGHIDIAVDEGFIDLIVDQISNGSTLEIKIESIGVIKNIFEWKSSFASTLVDEHQLVSLLLNMDVPSNRNMDFVETALSALTNIIQLCEENLCEENLVRQQISECGSLRKIENLLYKILKKNPKEKDIKQNKKIQLLLKKIYNFVKCAAEGDGEEYCPETKTSSVSNNSSARRSKRIKKSVTSPPADSLQPESLAGNINDVLSVSQSHVSSNSAADNDLLQNEDTNKSEAVEQELYDDFDEPSELQLPVNSNIAAVDTPSNQIDTVLSHDPALDVPSTSNSLVCSENATTRNQILVTRRKRPLINQVEVHGNKRIKVEIEETNDHAEMQNNLNEPSQRQMSVNPVTVAVDTAVKNEPEDHLTPVDDNLQLNGELPSNNHIQFDISAEPSQRSVNPVNVGVDTAVKVEIEERNNNAVNGEVQNNVNEPFQRQMSVIPITVAIDTAVKNEPEDHSTPVDDNLQLNSELPSNNPFVQLDISVGPSQGQISVNPITIAIDTAVKNEPEDHSTPVDVQVKRELPSNNPVVQLDISASDAPTPINLPELDNLNHLSRASSSFEHFIPEGMTENDIKDFSIKNSGSPVTEILYPPSTMNDVSW